MKKRLNRQMILHFLACGVLAAELLLLADAAVVFLGRTMPLAVAVLVLAVLTLLLCVLFRGRIRRLAGAAVLLPVLMALIAVLGYAGWSGFAADAGYGSPDAGKHQIYGGRRVMVIVPHQDDELNILGGVMDEYVRYGSELYAVFVTNGDYAGLAETRCREAVEVFADIGVPEENVIFLGYGNEWAEDGPHIYNAEPGAVVTSYIGETKTYGTKARPAYRQYRDYTIENLMEDMKSVILEYRPDVIFCSDYDHHIDHKAATLLFEKVMGQLLKEHRDYAPVVYKAYAYGTAWEAEPDYYADYVLSTADPFEEPYSQKPKIYRWEERVRLPMDASLLSRSLMTSGAFRQLALHKSQGAETQAASVINGDKVVWRRYTDSLCLHGDVSASSGDAGVLNDFMLIENRDLADRSHMPYDGVWIPEAEDTEKTAVVTLENCSDISVIHLYDHPSETDNILNMLITFDDGTVLETGPLDPGGAATAVAVGKKNVSSFEVSILEAEGALAGLSELEAFAQVPEADGRFVKLTDREGNFLYDVYTEPDGTAEMVLYTHGSLPELSEEAYSVYVTGAAGTVYLKDGVVHAACPVGEVLVLNITCEEAGVSDSITLRNPGAWERLWNSLWQSVESELYECYRTNAHKKLLIPYTFAKISYVLRHLN